MSEMLDKIETLATAEIITDPVLIDEIIKRFLDLKYSVLAKNESYESFVPSDIAKGLELTEQAVYECTVREMLSLIALESDGEWFNIPAEDRKIIKGYYPNSAAHCFMFARMLFSKQKKDIVVKQFMRIDYGAFMKYLSEMPLRSGKMTVYDDAYSLRRARIGSIYYQTLDQMSGFLKEDKDPSSDGSGLTLGKIINTAYKHGMAMWLCGIQPLTGYGESVREAYLVVNSLFIDCINEYLTDMNSARIRKLLYKCRMAGTQSVYDIRQTFDPNFNINAKEE